MPYVPDFIVDVPVRPKDEVFTTTVQVQEVIKKKKIVTETITSINNIDSTLSELTPTYIHEEDYPGSTVFTVVYDTPKSNSRILVIYNKQTKETKVVDYTKISKNIEPYRVV